MAEKLNAGQGMRKYAFHPERETCRQYLSPASGQDMQGEKMLQAKTKREIFPPPALTLGGGNFPGYFVKNNGENRIVFMR